MGKGLPRSLKKLYQESTDKGGTPAAGTKAAGSGYFRKEVISFDNVLVPLVDNAGVVAHAGLKIYDMPAGHVIYMGAVMDLVVTKDHATGVSDTWAGDVGLGSVTEDGTVGPLDGNFIDLIPNTATPPAVSGSAAFKAESTATESGTHFDGSATPMDVFFNVLVDDGDHDVTTNPTNLILNGTITLLFANMGDN